MGDEGGVASGIQPDRIATVRIIPIKVWGGEGGGGLLRQYRQINYTFERGKRYIGTSRVPRLAASRFFFFFFFQALFFFHRKNDVGLRNG